MYSSHDGLVLKGDILMQTRATRGGHVLKERPPNFWRPKFSAFGVDTAPLPGKRGS